MKLIVGLGNPGIGYETTRHNIGFLAADMLADKLGVNFHTTKHQALVASGNWQGEKYLICKPQTYMNLSGLAVRSLVEYYKLSVEDLVVIYDDMDLDLGRLRIRGKGSSGGQKGMAHIIENLGTEEIKRIRLGIGRPPQGISGADYVLGAFSHKEWEKVQEVLPKACDAALAIFTEGLEIAMSKYNS